MIAVVVGSETGSVVAAIHQDSLQLWGFAAAETSTGGAEAEIVIRHGYNENGTMLFPPVHFAAKGFAYPTFLPSPISCKNGIFIERRSGETTLVLYLDYI